MRWDRLFDDLDAQWGEAEASEEAALASDEAQYDDGRRSLADRLAAVAGAAAPIHVTSRAGHRLSVHLARVGPDWLTGRIEPATREPNALIPLAAVASLLLPVGSGDAAAAVPVSRVGVTSLLRDLGRRRHPLRIVSESGDRHGRILRVGADHLDFLEADRDVIRAGRAVTLVPFAAIDHLRY